MRLAKFLARAGIASRRRAEDMIKTGRVHVNGIVVDQPQFRVQNGDSVTVDGKPVVEAEEKVYLLLHKPPGYISTVRDTHNRPTVMDLVKGIDQRLYPVGRLDADTSGVLLMTNDGELANRLTHPGYRVKKVYLAHVSGNPGKEALTRLENGVEIEGRKAVPVAVRIVDRFEDKNETLLGIVLAEGRKRQVKKMCEAVGLPVKKLRRVEFAGIRTGSLPAGSFRHLTGREVEKLYRLVNL